MTGNGFLRTFITLAALDFGSPGRKLYGGDERRRGE
jgi:hypothetical protein